MRMKDCSIVANLLDALSVKLLKNCKHLTSSTHSLTSAHRSWATLAQKSPDLFKQPCGLRLWKYANKKDRQTWWSEMAQHGLLPIGSAERRKNWTKNHKQETIWCMVLWTSVGHYRWGNWTLYSTISKGGKNRIIYARRKVSTGTDFQRWLMEVLRRLPTHRASEGYLSLMPGILQSHSRA